MNSVASQSSNSGWVGIEPCVPKSSLVSTIPRPKSCSQYRLTVTRAVSGLSSDTSQFARPSQIRHLVVRQRIQNVRNTRAHRKQRIAGSQKNAPLTAISGAGSFSNELRSPITRLPWSQHPDPYRPSPVPFLFLARVRIEQWSLFAVGGGQIGRLFVRPLRHRKIDNVAKFRRNRNDHARIGHAGYREPKSPDPALRKPCHASGGSSAACHL